MYSYPIHCTIHLQVSTELVTHAKRSPTFHFNLREVRKRMVGLETSDLLRYMYMKIQYTCSTLARLAVKEEKKENPDPLHYTKTIQTRNTQ